MKPAYPAREFILRVLYFCLGTAVCALGCSAFVLSGIGTDPFSMLMQGVARTAHISNGAAHIAINFTLLVLYFFIDRKYILLSDKLHLQFRWMRVAVDLTFVVSGLLLGGVIGVGTVITALLTGPIVQFFMPRTARLLYSILRRLTPQAESA